MQKTVEIRKLFIIFSAVLLLPVLAFAGSSTKTENWEFTATPDSNISIENINGDITISASKDETIKVVAHLKAKNEKGLENLRVEMSQKGDDFVFVTHTKKSSGSWFHWGGSSDGQVSFDVSLPAYVNLKNIETVNGDVEINGVTSNTMASTVNGDLRLTGLAGNATLETVNGSIKVEFQKFEDAQKAEIETVNGSVVVYLPVNASTRVNAETVNGSIKAGDFNLTENKGRFVGSDLNGQIGAGGAKLAIETVNGSIKVKSGDS